MNEVLKAFIVGSSAPIILPSIYRVYNIPECVSDANMVGCKNYSYRTYTLSKPITAGLVSVAAYALRYKFSISLFYSFLIIEMINIIFILFYVCLFKFYNFKSREDWFMYALKIIAFQSLQGSTAYYITKNIM